MGVLHLVGDRLRLLMQGGRVGDCRRAEGVGTKGYKLDEGEGRGV